MTTARDVCMLALKEAGVLGVGQTPLAEDINDTFTLLNRMLAQWQKKRWLIPNLYEVSGIGNNAKSNLIGPGQYYNSARPDKIQAAYMVQLTGNVQSDPVSFPLRQIWSYEDYALLALKKLNSWPMYFFYDGAFPYGNVYIWPIPTEQYEIHLIVKGPIGFTVQLEAGEIISGGENYIDGNYLDVPFTNITGFGSEGTADVTVAGGVVTDILIHTPGDGYKINDTLGLDNTLMGGVGSGFIWKVTQVTDSLDAEFNMPPEYEDAIHYNLCVRLCTMYQLPTNPTQVALAKLALNTIKIANAQIPTLRMPPQYLSRRSYGSFYIFNADAR
jgi:hypothetical protein